jgi:hypothetical protein
MENRFLTIKSARHSNHFKRPPALPVNMTTRAGGSTSTEKTPYGYIKQRKSRLQIRNKRVLNASVDLASDSMEKSQSVSSMEQTAAHIRNHSTIDTTGADSLFGSSTRSMYMTDQELPNSKTPDADLIHALAMMKGNSWSDQFEGINIVRGLVKHH